MLCCAHWAYLENMDPLAMASTALSILKKIKEQVKECEAAFVEARELRMQIEGFEVTSTGMMNALCVHLFQGEPRRVSARFA
jgi:hypothetical protein